MAPIQKVAIVGASGNIGAPLTESITAAGFDVTVISRKSSSSTFGSLKVISVADDYPLDEVTAAFKGQDAVISTLNMVPPGTQERLVDAAIAAGVQRFVPSEFGSDTSNPEVLKLVTILAGKRALIEYLSARQDKISWTGIVNGPFFEWGLKMKFIGFDLAGAKATLTDAGRAKFSTSQFSQIGETLVAALRNPAASANRYVYVESFCVSQQEILAALEKSTGKKYEITQQDGKELVANSQAGLAAGNHFAAYGLIQAGIFIEGQGGDYHAKAARDQATFGIKPLDLQTEVDKAVKNLLG